MGTGTQITLIFCVTLVVISWITRDKRDGDK